MKQFLKNTTAAVLITLIVGSGQVRASSVEAPTETVTVLAEYVEKISKVAYYIDTIAETANYIKSVGKEGINAAVDGLLSLVGGLTEDFQGMLHFSDASSFSQLLDTAEDALSGDMDALAVLGGEALSIGGDALLSSGDPLLMAIGGAASVAGDVTVHVASGGDTDLGTMTGVVAGSVIDSGITAATGGAGIEGGALGGSGIDSIVGDALGGSGIDSVVSNALGGSDLGSVAKDALGNVDVNSLAKNALGNVDAGALTGNALSTGSGSGKNTQQNYGKPQDSKDAAEQYIRTTFFYSMKEGDKYEGEELKQRDQALLEVLKNRKGYQLEILATNYATAVENRTKGHEESMKRYENVKQKADSAESSDDKKAAEALITQEETRQRINRLSLELAILERDAVEDMLKEPADILIARTVEQIKSETQTENETVDFEEQVVEAKDDGTDDTTSDSSKNPYQAKKGGQS